MFLLYKENKFRTLFLHTEIHLNPQDFTGKRGEPCVANNWISMIRNYNRHKQLPKVQYLILTSIHLNTSSFLAFLFNIRFLSSSCIFAECCVAEPTFWDELTWPRANSIFCRRKKKMKSKVIIWQLVNILTTMSDQNTISFHNIYTKSSRQVMRIKKSINNVIITWSNAKFSELTS